MGAWFFFRQFKLAPVACVLGGLAAVLNSDFFSVACWGVAGQCITFGMSYVAAGLLLEDTSRHRWFMVVLAGMAVGMGLMEGADIGAIFSLCVAAFVMYQAVIRPENVGQRIFKGVLRTAVVAVFAGLIAAQFIVVMFKTQIQGVAGAQPETQTQEQHWDWATQWSLPKAETFSLLVPGLFGYRMDTPDGGQYWGTIGRMPGWRPEFGPNNARQSGGGIYAGILVLLVAFWALFQSFRNQGSPFTWHDRRWIWFWSGLALISLLLAYGRHAPFYRFIYALPYFSNIRNPAKFIHCFNWAVVVLFAYGVHGLMKSYVGESLKNARKWFTGFEKKWTLGMLGFVGLCLVGAVFYASRGRALENYLTQNAFNLTEAREIVTFSNEQVQVFILFLVIAVVALILLQRRTFVGQRARWAGIVLGIVLVVDMVRANEPWIQYYDYRDRYASNPVVNFLRQQPYEHRVAILPFRVNQAMGVLQQIYYSDWLQHSLPYYGIQSIDIIQESRTLVENQQYRALWTDTNVISQWLPGNPIVRQWQLANVEYLLGVAGVADLLNRQLDPKQQRFREVFDFELPNLNQQDFATVRTNTTGPFAMIEFAGALPRARLYAQWQSSTNDQATLQQLADPQFDPTQTVLVAEEIAGPPPGQSATNRTLKPVEFVANEYAPKQVVLRTDADVPTVLLLTDKYDPDWKVTVDGQAGRVLRCNFLMRGVALPAGKHEVRFNYAPSAAAFYVSLLAEALALGLGGFLAWSSIRRIPPP